MKFRANIGSASIAESAQAKNVDTKPVEMTHLDFAQTAAMMGFITLAPYGFIYLLYLLRDE